MSLNDGAAMQMLTSARFTTIALLKVALSGVRVVLATTEHHALACRGTRCDVNRYLAALGC